MGMICPCTRQHSTLSGDETREERPPMKTGEAVNTQSREGEFSFTLLSDEKIARLVGPLELYYKKRGELPAPPGLKLLLAQYISTQQPCVVLLVPKTPQRCATEFKSALLERLITLDHPQILRMFETMQDLKNFYIVSERFDEGQMEEFISQGGPLTERCAATAIHHVLSALVFAHSHGIFHGEINGRTVVVKCEVAQDAISVKMTGFEYCLLREEDSITVPSPFEAPERGEPSEKSDIWSCGVLLVYMLTGLREVPSSFSPLTLSHRTVPAVSPDLLSLLSAMLNRDPRSRPTALECISHSWLQRCSSHPSRAPPTQTSLDRLCSSAAPVSLREALIRFLINRVMKDSEIAKLAASFQSIDANGDGLISEEEIYTNLLKTMPAEEAAAEAKRILEKTDKNANGKIEYSEFLMSSFSKEQVLSRDNLRAAFKALDVDESGSISISELKRFFILNSSRNIDEDWRSLIQKYDTSGDGEIDFEEFEALMWKAYDKQR